MHVIENHTQHKTKIFPRTHQNKSVCITMFSLFIFNSVALFRFTFFFPRMTKNQNEMLNYQIEETPAIWSWLFCLCVFIWNCVGGTIKQRLHWLWAVISVAGWKCSSKQWHILLCFGLFRAEEYKMILRPLTIYISKIDEKSERIATGLKAFGCLTVLMRKL